MKWVETLRGNGIRPSSDKTPESAFHAVAIQCGGTACPGAKRLEGTRYLSRESPPRLPLSSCDRPGTCQCRYRHHMDRRVDARRASDHVWAPTGKWSGSVERRQARGRRATD